MENKSYNEEKFDSFLNKTIILSSKKYFKRQMKLIDREPTIVNDADYADMLQEFVVLNSVIASFENKDELNNAVRSLSAIEQSVIFLLFKEELSQEDASKILEICSKSVSRIKLRALAKLKNYLKGENDNEK